MKFCEKFEVPPETTQRGIAEVIGARRSHVSLALSSLKEKECVEERTTHISGEIRKRKSYFLTPKGMQHAQRFKNTLEEKVVTIKEGEEAKEIKIRDISDYLGEKYHLIDVLCCLSKEGVLNVKALTGEELAVEAKREMEERKVPVEKMGIWVRCPRCFSSFYAEGMFEGDFGYTYCPSCNERFFLYGLAAAKERMAPEPSASPIILATILLVLSFALPFLLPASVLCVSLIALSVLILVLIVLGLRGAKTIKGKVRKAFLAFSVLLALFTTTMIKLLLTLRLEYDLYIDLAVVIAPLFGIILFARPIPQQTRGELSVSAGVFLFLVGVFSAFTPEVFYWTRDFSPYWTIFGIAAIITAFEIKKPMENSWILVSLGTGIFIIAYSATWIIRNYQSLGSIPLSALLLWLLVGAILIPPRFVKREKGERIIAAMKGSLLFGIGVILLLTGALLLFSGRYIESFLEFLLGILVAGYGIKKSPRENVILRVGIFALITFLEVLTIASVFWT